MGGWVSLSELIGVMRDSNESLKQQHRHVWNTCAKTRQASLASACQYWTRLGLEMTTTTIMIITIIITISAIPESSRLSGFGGRDKQIAEICGRHHLRWLHSSCRRTSEFAGQSWYPRSWSTSGINGARATLYTFRSSTEMYSHRDAFVSASRWLCSVEGLSPFREHTSQPMPLLIMDTCPYKVFLICYDVIILLLLIIISAIHIIIYESLVKPVQRWW